jgi:hypothetical protein
VAAITRFATRTYTAAEQAAALIAPARRWAYRYDVVTKDGTVKGQLEAIDASVSLNDLADGPKRTCSLTLTLTELFEPLSDRVRAHALLAMPDGGWCEWVLGTFHLNIAATSWATAAGPTTLDGQDSLIVLVEDKFDTRYRVAKNANYRTAVVAILNGAGFAKTNIATTSDTLPADMEWEPGTSKLEAINALLDEAGFRDLTMDATGVPTAAQYVKPAQAPVVWTYTVDASSVVQPGVDVTLDLDEVPNKWIAFVSEPDRPVIRSAYVNSDPNSILSTVSRGRTIVEVLDTSNVKPKGPKHGSKKHKQQVIRAATQAILDDKVQQAAEDASGQYEFADFSTGLMPFHGSGDVALIDYGSGTLRYRETEWSATLAPGGAMTHKFRRVVTV